MRARGQFLLYLLVALLRVVVLNEAFSGNYNRLDNAILQCLITVVLLEAGIDLPQFGSDELLA